MYSRWAGDRSLGGLSHHDCEATGHDSRSTQFTFTERTADQLQVDCPGMVDFGGDGNTRIYCLLRTNTHDQIFSVGTLS
jgi:hypothetical protein